MDGRRAAPLRRAGLPLAPVHGLRLSTRRPARVISTCAQARRQARIAVVCPPLVPTDGVVADRGLYGAEVKDAGGFYLLTFNNGDNPGHVHWIVGAGRGARRTPRGGELGGHDLALAHLRGITYFASLHGRRDHDVDAAMLIAMLLTAPARAQPAQSGISSATS